jgi:DNA-binding SARP family transcriptional activator
VEKNADSVISQLLAMNASWDSKQLQHLLEMEKREEQQLLNVAQAKYQSYQRKDVISEYCSGLCYMLDSLRLSVLYQVMVCGILVK